MDVENKIKVFLKEEMLIELGSDYQEKTDLFVEGLMDSYALVELVNFVESEFKVKVKDEDLVNDNFNSFASIVEWINDQTNEKA